MSLPQMSTEGDYKCVIQTDTDGVLNVPADPSETSSGDQSITCTVPLVSNFDKIVELR